mgnify:FL=1
MLLQNCGEVHILFCIKFNKIQFYILYLEKLETVGNVVLKRRKGKKNGKRILTLKGEIVNMK